MSRITGNIPVGVNFEPDLIYPLDSRQLADKFSSILDPSWWCGNKSQFALYKGMMVACANTGNVYVYTGNNIRLKHTDKKLDASNWKLQTTSFHNAIFPLSINNDAIRVGTDYINDKNEKQGYYLSAENNMRSGSIFIGKNFISLGTNNNSNSDASIPYIPQLVNPSPNNVHQCGIYIPTQSNKVPLCITTGDTTPFIFQSGADTSIIYTHIDISNGIIDVSTKKYKSTIQTINIDNTSSNINTGVLVLNSSNMNIKNNSSFILSSHDINIDCSTSNINYDNLICNIKNKTVIKTTELLLSKQNNNEQYISIINSSINLYNKEGNININAKTTEFSGNTLNVVNKNINFAETIKITNATAQLGNNNILDVSAKKINFISNVNGSYFDVSSNKLDISVLSNNIHINNGIDISTNILNINSANNIKYAAQNHIFDGSIYFWQHDTGGYVFEKPSATDNSTGILLYKTKALTGDSSILTWLAPKDNKTSYLRYSNGEITWDNGLLQKTIEVSNTDQFINIASYDTKGLTDIKANLTININTKSYSVIYHININNTNVNIQDFSNYPSDKSLIKITKNGNSIYVYIVPPEIGILTWDILTYNINPNKNDKNDVIKWIFHDPKLVLSTIGSDNNINITLHKNLSITVPSNNASSFKQNLCTTSNISAPTTGGAVNQYLTCDSNGNLGWTGTGFNVTKLGTETDSAIYNLLLIKQFSENSIILSNVDVKDNVYIDQNANLFATAYYATSDIRLKNNINDIEYNDSSLLQLKQFNYNNTNKLSYGFIAQDVEDAGYSDIVYTDPSSGYKKIDYNSAFAILISQLQHKIDSQNTVIQRLQNKLQILENKLK